MSREKCANWDCVGVCVELNFIFVRCTFHLLWMMATIAVKQNSCWARVRVLILHPAPTAPTFFSLRVGDFWRIIYQINHFRGIYDIRPYQYTYIKQVVIIRTPFFTLVLDITLICKQELDLRKWEASEHDIRLLITAVTKAMSHSCVK